MQPRNRARAILIATADRIYEPDTITTRHHPRNILERYINTQICENPAINHPEISRMQNRATMRAKRNTLSMRANNNGAHFGSYNVALKLIYFARPTKDVGQRLRRALSFVLCESEATMRSVKLAAV